ncbi:putative chorismate mutase [Rhodospirillaceae bacterium LM-1]|nr:putative chorismate mutase [Rhodospirillaceae bacterium LM-1]
MSKDPTLASLRKKIDGIDTKLHDLLMQRAQVVESVGELKKAQKLGAPFRLGREAEILRRLKARHQGLLPYPVIARLWREIIASFTQLEAAYAVSVCQPSPDAPVRDLARDHYGGGVALLSFAQPGPALVALSEGKAVQAVLSMPRPDDETPWWPMLMDGAHAPRIVARLPFAGTQGPGREALVAALFPPEASGDDVSLLGIETDEPASRTGLKTELEKAGFSQPRLLAAGRYGAKSLALAEVDGFVEAQDARLTTLSMPRILVLGAYARPILE